MTVLGQSKNESYRLGFMNGGDLLWVSPEKWIATTEIELGQCYMPYNVELMFSLCSDVT